MDSEKISDFLQECDDFSVWLENAPIEELELYAASDGWFIPFLDMMETRKKNDKTIIIVTHKYSLLKNCDQIFELKKGLLQKIL